MSRLDDNDVVRPNGDCDDPPPSARRRGPALGQFGLRRRRHAAQRLLRSDAGALCRLQQGLCRPIRKETGKSVEIKQSHGGSGSQARAVIDGLQADVVTLALAYDIDAIAEQGAACDGLAERSAAEHLALYLDHRVPGAQGKPQGHQGLGRPGQARRQRHHAKSKNLGRGALELSGGLGLRAEEIRLRRQGAGNSSAISTATCRCSTTGARGSTITFVERGVGDVLLAWENEAFLAQREFGKDKFEIVAPPRSILAEPPVAVVDTVADQQGHPGCRGGLSEVLVHARKARKLPHAIPIVRVIPRLRRSMKAPSPRSNCSPSMMCSAAGPRRRRSTSPKAASSIRSTRTDRGGVTL